MSAALPTLGVDPGRTGAACLLAPDGRTVLQWWTWTHRVRKAGDVYVLRWSRDPGHDHTLPSLCAVAGGIARRALPTGLHVSLVVEGLFVPQGRVNGAMTLGECTGELIGPLREISLGPILRPTAGTWRPAVLGIRPNTRAAEAELRAVQAVRAGLVDGLEINGDGHLAEAACIARWGWVQQQRGGER